MAKKRNKQEDLLKSNNSIIQDLRNNRWIYNPVVYSQISGDFTLLQQRILIGVVERLQQRIIDSVEARKQSGSFLDIFDKSELSKKETLELQIPADDLGVLPTHYDQLSQAATALGKITTKYPLYDKNGNIKSYVVAALFPRIEMPVYKKEVDGRIEDSRRTGVLRVVMLTENIRDIFSMQQGYIKHVSHIARLAQKKRTPRLYIFLSRYKEVGHKKVPYKDLIEYLGLTDEYFFEQNYDKDSDKKEPTTNPYTSWAEVKRLVLVPVKKEMDSLAFPEPTAEDPTPEPKINFSFDFEPIYPAGKPKRGIPSEILFTIKTSKMGEEKMKEDKRVNMIYNFVNKYLDWCPDLSDSTLIGLVEDMDERILEQFVSFAFNDVRAIVERKQPDDVASYVVGVLKKWKRDNIRQSVPIQGTLFDETEEQTAEETSVDMLRYDKEDAWLRIMQEYDGANRAALTDCTFYGTEHGNFCLVAKSLTLAAKYQTLFQNDTRLAELITRHNEGYGLSVIFIPERLYK